MFIEAEDYRSIAFHTHTNVIHNSRFCASPHPPILFTDGTVAAIVTPTDRPTDTIFVVLQAHLPLGETSLKMGTPDGGRTVLNACPNIEKAASQAADILRLRAHTVGGKLRMERYREAGSEDVSYRKVNAGGHVLHAAADVEGHEGADSR